MIAGPLTENDGVQQGVGAQAVAAVDADVGALAGGVNPGNAGQAVNVGLDAAHDVVHPRANGHGLLNHVHAGQVNADFPDLAELLHDQRFAQVGAIQEDAAVDAVAGVDFGLFGPGNHVAGSQLHHVGSVPLHEAVAVLVPQVGALAAGGFGQQDATAGQGGGMVLDHLHVHQADPGVVSQRHAVAGDDEGVGGGFKNASATAGAENDRLGADGVNLTRA